LNVDGAGARYCAGCGRSLPPVLAVHQVIAFEALGPVLPLLAEVLDERVDRLLLVLVTIEALAHMNARGIAAKLS
jgi:hypothetical protein